MAILYRPSVWQNDRITLYHGTDEESANLIIRGIDLRHCRPWRDFGRGFYTTTSKRQAEYWASFTAGKSLPQSSPAIVAFDVDPDRLARLDALIFVRGDFEAESFWSLVCRCREQDVDHGRAINDGWYDLVAGPVAASWVQRAAFGGYDQFSFHTQTAVSVLDASSPHLVT